MGHTAFRASRSEFTPTWREHRHRAIEQLAQDYTVNRGRAFTQREGKQTGQKAENQPVSETPVKTSCPAEGCVLKRER